MGLQTRVERLPLVGPWLKQAGILLWRNSLLQVSAYCLCGHLYSLEL